MKLYACCSTPHPEITFTVLIRRKTLFHIINFIIPCASISFLTILVFYLPSQSGEKVSLSISILLSLTVFFLVLAEIIPPTSLVIPLIGKFLLFTTLLVTLSILATAIVLNVHFRSAETCPVPAWCQRLLFGRLSRVLGVIRPPPTYDSLTSSNDKQTSSDCIKNSSRYLIRRWKEDEKRPTEEETITLIQPHTNLGVFGNRDNVHFNTANTGVSNTGISNEGVSNTRSPNTSKPDKSNTSASRKYYTATDQINVPAYVISSNSATINKQLTHNKQVPVNNSATRFQQPQPQSLSSASLHQASVSAETRLCLSNIEFIALHLRRQEERRNVSERIITILNLALFMFKVSASYSKYNANVINLLL